MVVVVCWAAVQDDGGIASWRSANPGVVIAPVYFGHDAPTGLTVILHLLLVDDRDDDQPYDEDDPKEEQHVLLCFADFHFFFLFDSESVVVVLHQVPAAALSSRTRLQVGDVRSLLSCSATKPASTAAR